MGDLKEHFELILWLVGALFSALMFCVAYIGKQFSREMQTDREQRERVMHEFALKIDKIEGYLSGITDEMFERLRKAEVSLSKIWAEHRMMREFGGCNFVKLEKDSHDKH